MGNCYNRVYRRDIGYIRIMENNVETAIIRYKEVI